MTTVINYNVLNFITMKLNNITLNNDVRSNHQHLDDSRKTYPWEQDQIGDVIDITPHSRTHHAGEVRALSGPLKIGIIYNREGKPVQAGRAKGLLVDTYA